MAKLLSLIFIGLGLFFLTTSLSEDEVKKAELTVLLDNIRNKEGKIYVFIYSYENQYPDNPYLNFEIDKKLVSDFGTVRYSIPDVLTQGKYAISLLDDENANDDLDMFLGIPTEGYGFSNNVEPFLSMPDYEDLLFDLSTDKKTVNLTLQYVL